jgi:hypothetical protein
LLCIGYVTYISFYVVGEYDEDEEMKHYNRIMFIKEEQERHRRVLEEKQNEPKPLTREELEEEFRRKKRERINELNRSFDLERQKYESSQSSLNKSFQSSRGLQSNSRLNSPYSSQQIYSQPDNLSLRQQQQDYQDKLQHLQKLNNKQFTVPSPKSVLKQPSTHQQLERPQEIQHKPLYKPEKLEKTIKKPAPAENLTIQPGQFTSYEPNPQRYKQGYNDLYRNHSYQY